jgi:hypothetical protein
VRTDCTNSPANDERAGHRPSRPTCSRSGPASRSSHNSRERRLERETGIEPATNSLEGCDSTTELLPPSCFALRRGKPAEPALTRLAARCAVARTVNGRRTGKPALHSRLSSPATIPPNPASHHSRPILQRRRGRCRPVTFRTGRVSRPLPSDAPDEHESGAGGQP